MLTLEVGGEELVVSLMCRGVNAILLSPPCFSPCVLIQYLQVHVIRAPFPVDLGNVL